MWERGVEFKGGSLHDSFDGFGGSGEHLALLLLALHRQCQETTITVLAVSAVVAVSVVMATPLKLNPPFSVILKAVWRGHLLTLQPGKVTWIECVVFAGRKFLQQSAK